MQHLELKFQKNQLISNYTILIMEKIKGIILRRFNKDM